MRCFHFRLCIRGRSDNLATGVPTPGTDDELLVKGRAENVSPGERGNGFSSSLSSVRDGLKVRPCVGVGHAGLDIARLWLQPFARYPVLVLHTGGSAAALTPSD